MQRYKNEVLLQVREEIEQDPIIYGYFAKFDVETELYRGNFEKIAKGAFAQSLANNDIRCLFNHDTSFVLGRMKSKTLTLKEDDVGLYGELVVNRNDSAAMNVYHQVKRGDISGCSFGFIPIETSIDKKGDGYIETLNNVSLHEVSICSFPQYDQTEISARSVVIDDKEKREQLKRRIAKHVETKD